MFFEEKHESISPCFLAHQQVSLTKYIITQTPSWLLVFGLLCLFCLTLPFSILPFHFLPYLSLFCLTFSFSVLTLPFHLTFPFLPYLPIFCLTCHSNQCLIFSTLIMSNIKVISIHLIMLIVLAANSIFPFFNNATCLFK